jgi:hypothetical protein
MMLIHERKKNGSLAGLAWLSGCFAGDFQCTIAASQQIDSPDEEESELDKSSPSPDNYRVQRPKGESPDASWLLYTKKYIDRCDIRSMEREE